MRFGYFQLRGIPYSKDNSPDTILQHAERGTLEIMDRLSDHGLVYDPDNLSPTEIETIKRFVSRYNRLAKKYRPNMPHCVF
jgi:hypothetical protein